MLASMKSATCRKREREILTGIVPMLSLHPRPFDHDTLDHDDFPVLHSRTWPWSRYGEEYGRDVINDDRKGDNNQCK